MAFPKMKSCPGPAKGLIFSSQHSKGNVGSGEMLQTSHCSVDVYALMTGRTWVYVWERDRSKTEKRVGKTRIW